MTKQAGTPKVGQHLCDGSAGPAAGFGALASAFLACGFKALVGFAAGASACADAGAAAGFGAAAGTAGADCGCCAAAALLRSNLFIHRVSSALRAKARRVNHFESGRLGQNDAVSEMAVGDLRGLGGDVRRLLQLLQRLRNRPDGPPDASLQPHSHFSARDPHQIQASMTLHTAKSLASVRK